MEFSHVLVKQTLIRHWGFNGSLRLCQVMEEGSDFNIIININYKFLVRRARAKTYFMHKFGPCTLRNKGSSGVFHQHI
jgi:hypothetical protein